MHNHKLWEELAGRLTVAVSHRDLVHVRQQRRDERVARRRHSSTAGASGVHGCPGLSVPRLCDRQRVHKLRERFVSPAERCRRRDKRMKEVPTLQRDLQRDLQLADGA